MQLVYNRLPPITTLAHEKAKGNPSPIYKPVAELMKTNEGFTIAQAEYMRMVQMIAKRVRASRGLGFGLDPSDPNTKHEVAAEITEIAVGLMRAEPSMPLCCLADFREKFVTGEYGTGYERLDGQVIGAAFRVYAQEWRSVARRYQQSAESAATALQSGKTGHGLTEDEYRATLPPEKLAEYDRLKEQNEFLKMAQAERDYQAEEQRRAYTAERARRQEEELRKLQQAIELMTEEQLDETLQQLDALPVVQYSAETRERAQRMILERLHAYSLAKQTKGEA